MANLKNYGGNIFSKSRRSRALSSLHNKMDFSEWCELSKSKQNNLIKAEMIKLKGENKKYRRDGKILCKKLAYEYAA